MKKFSKTKDGRQVYRTLRAVLLSGQQVVSTGITILSKLKSFRYEGDQNNFSFVEYVNLHVEQHNQHSDLQEYRAAPLEEKLTIPWFLDFIKCSSLDTVKVSINANHANFSDLTL
jgi:hypothetical protein